MRDAWRGILERADGGARAAFGPVFQAFPAGLHQHDNQRGERLAEHESADDRERGDDVAREPPAEHIEHRSADGDAAHEDDRAVPNGGTRGRHRESCDDRGQRQCGT